MVLAIEERRSTKVRLKRRLVETTWPLVLVMVQDTVAFVSTTQTAALLLASTLYV